MRLSTALVNVLWGDELCGGKQSLPPQTFVCGAITIIAQMELVPINTKNAQKFGIWPIPSFNEWLPLKQLTNKWLHDTCYGTPHERCVELIFLVWADNFCLLCCVMHLSSYTNRRCKHCNKNHDDSLNDCITVTCRQVLHKIIYASFSFFAHDKNNT